MKKIGRVFALALVVGLPSAGLAAPLTYTATFDVAVMSGPDGAGLGGATLTFSVLFASGTVYTPFVGTPGAVSTSHTLTVSSGPSMGVYSHAPGVVWAPFFELFTDPGFFFPVFGPLAGGVTLTYALDLAPAPVPPIGAGVMVGDFGATIDFAFSSFTASDTTVYVHVPGTVTAGPTGGPTPVELLSFEIE